MIYQQNKNKNENVEEKNTKCIYEIRRVSILVIMERENFWWGLGPIDPLTPNFALVRK